MWRKSSRSAGSGECVEAASWRAATCQGGACVEVGHGAAVIGVRDSQDRDGGRLEFAPAAWAAFTGRLKAR